MEDRSQELPRLKRSLTLLPTVLYGLGVTIGAGIYVLIGIAAGRAGMHAPLAFLIAALLLSLTACSFAELAGRLPVSASEAAYVREGLGSPLLALIVGLLVIAAAIVAAAAISVGSAGYVRAFELLCLGQPCDAEAAVRAGLANAVVPQDQLEATALAAARRLADKPRDALMLSRRLLRGDNGAIVKRLEEEAAIFGERLTSPEAKEAFAAFFEKRAPDFRKLRGAGKA